MQGDFEHQMTPAVVAALDELKVMISARYPQATFVVAEGVDDPPGLYLVATVDVEDTDEVRDVYGDRLLEMNIEEGLPVYVNTVRPLEPVLAELRARKAAGLLEPLPY